jgi:HEAT repeat protein
MSVKTRTASRLRCITLASAEFNEPFRGVQRAIPKLIALLDYHVEVLGRKPARWQEYPAISSLSSFGVTAVPALVAEISKDPDEIKRKNALFALLDIRDARFPGTGFPRKTTE